MTFQKSKEVKIKLGIDGSKLRFRVAAKGHLATQSFEGLTEEAEGLSWIKGQLNVLLQQMKEELGNGTTR